MAQRRPGPGGPGRGPRGMMAPRGSMKGQWGLLGRVLRYMLRSYKWLFAIVVVCILTTAYCSL